jgi:hypothetical protein
MSDREHESIHVRPRHAARAPDETLHGASGEILPPDLAGDIAAKVSVTFGDVRVRHDAAADRDARQQGNCRPHALLNPTAH